jgi:hypothetical protein
VSGDYFDLLPHTRLREKNYDARLESDTGGTVIPKYTWKTDTAVLFFGVPEGRMRIEILTESGEMYHSPFFQVTGDKNIQVPMLDGNQ